MSDPRYKTGRWKRRARAQMQAEPLCRMCLGRGETKAARVADHIIPHRGDDRLFWEGDLQSLCDSCHSRLKQREEIHGFNEILDADGWPTDPRHLANQGTG